MRLYIWGICHEVSCSNFFIALSYCLSLFPLSCNFIFQQLYLSTWMQQNQSYQQHHPWDPRTLIGLGKHQQLRNLLLLPPVTFLKCHQRRALDTAKRKHCTLKACLILEVFDSGVSLHQTSCLAVVVSSVLVCDMCHHPGWSACLTHLSHVCESVLKKRWSVLGLQWLLEIFLLSLYL